MAIRTYHDLDVFRDAYAAPRSRSIPANIVEGWGKRASTPEFKRYLQIAIGSCDETRMWLDLSKDEGYISEKECNEVKSKYNRIGAMLGSLWKQWRGSPR